MSHPEYTPDPTAQGPSDHEQPHQAAASHEEDPDLHWPADIPFVDAPLLDHELAQEPGSQEAPNSLLAQFPLNDQALGLVTASGLQPELFRNVTFTPDAKPRKRLLAIADDPFQRARRRIGSHRESTLDDYRSRVRGLYRESMIRRTTDFEAPYQPSPLEVVQDVIASLETSRTPDSWRVVRSALIWHLSELKLPLAEQALKLLKQAKHPANNRTEAHAGTLGSGHGRGKRRQKRGISLQDMRLLFNGLAKSQRSDTGARIQIWLMAGIVCGARVTEWQGVRWLDREKGLLAIPNIKLKASAPAYLRRDQSMLDPGDPAQPTQAKEALDPDEAGSDDPDDYSADRPLFRVVRVHPEDAVLIDLQIACIWHEIRVGAAEGLSPERAFARYYDRCRQVIYTVGKEVFGDGRRFSLRVARSQFAANAKAEFALDEVSEMMGHLGSRVTMSHYAPRSAAHRGGERFRSTHRHAPAQTPRHSPG